MRHSDLGLCAVCHRQSRGFGWFNANLSVDNPGRDESYRQLCSRICQDLCHRRRGMIDPTPNERAAMEHGGAMAGEFLDSLGKTDLAQLSVDEWHALIEVIVTGYCDHLRDLAGQDRSRLDGITEQVPF
jgi:hypothetical protein